MDELNALFTPQALLLVMLAVWCIWMIVMYLRRKRRLLSMLIGAGSGILTLLLWRQHGDILGYCPPLNLLTLSVSGVGGVPALMLMLGIELLMVTK